MDVKWFEHYKPLPWLSVQSESVLQVQTQTDQLETEQNMKDTELEV